jgi:hypothetical protein
LGFRGTKDTLNVTKTDENGNFEFLGLRGDYLGVLPEKEGYEFVQRGNGNWSDDYKADSNNRVIFRMWKLKGAERMVHVNLQATIPCDGTTTTYNLLTGRGKGDLEVTLTRNPVNINRSKPFDWTLTVGIANGGLVEDTDLYPYEAPASGYQQSDTIAMSADDKNWSPSISRSYYFQSAGGPTYGRMTINVMANFQPPPTLFDASVYANPSGSRNLEFDPFKKINQ